MISLERLRTLVLAGIGAATAFLPFLVFASAAGIGLASDSFFAALSVTQTVQAVLFAPFDFLLPGALLQREKSQTTSLWAALIAWLCLCVPATLVILTVGPLIGSSLFGSAVRSDPALWRHHLVWLALSMPLNGILLTLQFHAQAIGRFDLPKVAILGGRAIGLLIALALGPRLAIWMGATLLVAPLVGSGAMLVVLRPVGPTGAVAQTVRKLLLDWVHVTRWASLLRTDVLVDRALAANLTTGFLTAFNLLWVAVMNVAEAFQGSFAAADARRLHALQSEAALSREDVRVAFRDSTRAAWLLTGAAVLACTALELVGARLLHWTAWAPALRPEERIILLLLISVATAIFCFWKQVATRYSVEGRATEFARLLAITFLIFLIPRLLATRSFGVFGFCISLMLYYGTQVIAAMRDVGRPPAPLQAGAAGPLSMTNADHDQH